MSTIFMALNTANSALQADQASIETIGHNVANASTDGYSQQTANLVASPAYSVPSQNRAVGPGQIGTGVTVQGITRARDALLDTQFRYQNQLAGQWSTLDTEFGQVQGILPEPATTGLGKDLSAFWTSWQTVADDPSNLGGRATLQQAGISLATAFNSDAQQIAQAQQTADTAVQSNVATINNAATEIANLNGQIASVLAGGQQPNDLMDQRDLLLDKIANTIPITTSTQPNGMVTVNIATAVPGSTTLQVARPSAAPLVSGVTDEFAASQFDGGANLYLDRRRYRDHDDRWCLYRHRPTIVYRQGDRSDGHGNHCRLLLDRWGKNLCGVRQRGLAFHALKRFNRLHYRRGRSRRSVQLQRQSHRGFARVGCAIG